MYKTITKILLLTVLLAGCSSTSKKSANDVDTSASNVAKTMPQSSKNVVEAFIHTQPDIDLSYVVDDEKDDDKSSNTTKPRSSIYVKRSDTNIWDRMRKGFRLKPSLRPRVVAELRWYVNHPQYLERVYDRAELVLHYVLDEVEKRGMPSELALLPVVESAFQPFAFSHARASGIWQFIPSTGRIYGMKQNWWYDGRRDIIESTRGSLDYLTKLKNEFGGDYLLALASYNTGEGRVGREVRRNRRRGRPTSYWYLRLPRETRAYVPKLLAMAMIVRNPKKYGLTLRHIPDEKRIAAVDVGSQIDLAKAAELAGISLEDMYKLNPGYNRWATPPGGPHRLLLPIHIIPDFKKKLAKTPVSERMFWKKHKVTAGQTISSIASHYRVTPEILRRVNNVRGLSVPHGRTLKIPVSYVARSKYTLSLTQRVPSSIRTGTNEVKYRRTRRRILVRVRRGDTMYRIARRYRVSVRSLARWNGISTRKRLRYRQRLIVYRRSRGRRYVVPQYYRRRGMRAISYRVRRGDTLRSISRRFRVSPRSIKKWNKRKIRRRNYIYPGQRLKIYVRGRVSKKRYRKRSRKRRSRSRRRRR